MNIPTTLPFFNGTRKQNTRRDGSPITIFSPRNQLPPFQIQRVHDADQDVKEIALVDCDGNETDLVDFFRNSNELITGGWTNGPGGLQNYDTLTAHGNRDLSSVIKTTTGAGDAGAETTTDFAVTSGERLFLEVEMDLNSGVAPKAVIIDAGDETTELSNTVQLANGTNRFVFTITGTEVTAALLLYNDTADQTNFRIANVSPAAWITLTRTNWPTTYEFTSVDYIQYNGEGLRLQPLLNDRSWTNGTYDTFTTSGTAVTSAIEASSSATAYLSDVLGDIKIEDGEKYIIYVPNVVINSGQAPSFRLNDGTFHQSEYKQVSAGDNILEVTVAKSAGTDNIVYNGYVQATNTAAANWSCGPINIYRKTDLLPKGTHYLRISDDINEWYSEFFEIRDIYKNVISSLVNSGYETLETDGTRVTSAINTAGNGVIYSEATNDDFDIENDEVITVILFLTLNSGALPGISLTTNDTTSVISNAPTLAEGINVVTLTATQAAEQARIRIFNSANSNFSTSEIWVKRQYASDFVKLQFTNATDLRGKRSDDQTILYQNSFEQECWLNTILNTPESNPLEVGDEKDGLFIAEKVVSQQIYRIIDYVNRSLFEGLLRLPQHDDITIIDEVGNQYTPNIGNIRISIEWTTFDTGTLVIAFNDGSFVWTENSDDIT